jgi:hypothetical protein
LYRCTVMQPILYCYIATHVHCLGTPFVCISPCIVRILWVQSYWPVRL